MYRELLLYVRKKTLEVFPELSNEEEFDASFTHWLHERELSFFFRTEALIDLWERLVDSFLSSKQATLSEIWGEIPYPTKRGVFDFIDLFAGIGGFNLALSKNGGRCVFSSEWDKGAKNTYLNNYGKVPFGDINKFTNPDVDDEFLDQLIPEHQVLAAGFPCQPFSRAGVSARNALGLPHGFECETQGTLFHSIARIAFVKQPEIVFMENVRGLINHDGGATFNVIKTAMEELSQGRKDKKGYRFFYSVINSESLVPQRRVRCYMVCVREDVWQDKGGKDFNFPEVSGEALPLRKIVERTLPSEADTYTISDALWQGHIERTRKNLARKTGFTAFQADLDRPSNTIVARYGKDGKECLIPQGDKNPRKLTISECRQLFGYPEGFITPSSRSAAYKQFGNSVVVPVVDEIAREISSYLEC